MTEPTTIGGKYTLLRKLSSGGMAEVYLARQKGLVGFEKLVVLKRILPHLAQQPGFVQMFLDEARTAADLRHPNVVHIYEIGEDRGTYYIAMEFLDGQHLRHIEQRARERKTNLPLEVVLQVTMDAARGLQYAHTKTDLRGRPMGIVHRDVSPHNLVVTYEGYTKIVDFGIAKARTQLTATAPGVVKGKVAYLSPEQASGKELDGRSDIFSLGIILYELTTGTRLFLRSTEVATIHAVLSGEVKKPSEIAADYPRALEAIVLKALANNRDRRYEDAATLVDDLQAFAVAKGLRVSPGVVSDFLHQLYDEEIREQSLDLLEDVEPDGAPDKPTQLSPSADWRTGGDATHASGSQALAPRGLVTLVFTDIEASTNLWERKSSEMELALDLHNTVLREQLLLLGGYEVKTEGDSFMAAFGDTLAAVKWCLSVQERLMNLPWPEALLEHPAAAVVEHDGKPAFRGLRVRMGIHIGRPACHPNPVTGRMDYFGPTVNRAARVADAAHGGQVLVTQWVLQEVAHKLETSLDDPHLVDLGEHRLKGLDSPVHIHQILPASLAARTFPTIRTMETRRTNLSAPMGRLIGRDEAIASLHELVERDDTRLITVQGTGGTGKTRLVHEYGWTHQDDFASHGGVWFFDLTQARSLDGVCNAVAKVFNVTLTRGQTADDMVEQLSHVLASRGRSLLIFDNFEQVVDLAPATLRRWITAAPDAVFVVTSQATLKLPGEHIFELAPLGKAGVELFIERAQEARPGFEPSDDDRMVIEQIVAQLDGLPLAIELAAARVKVLKPAKLLDRLSRRFDLLKGARRDATDRQATLRGAIEWSWNMLQPWEQAALSQCSVFRGGFTIDAVEEVIALDAFDEAPLEIDVVQSLRERSLLRVIELADSAGDLRFSMYESVRQFAASHLTEADRKSAERRHASFYLNVCAEWAQAIESESNPERMEELQLEIENLVAIHERALARPGDAEAAKQTVRAALALDPIMSARGPFNLHLQILDRTVERIESVSVFAGQACRVYVARGKARRARGQLSESQSDFERALELAREAGDTRQEGIALGYLGTVLQYQGQYDQAHACYRESLERLRTVGEVRYKGIVLGSLGVYHHEQGRMAEAQTLYEQALDLLSRAGDRHSEGIYVGNLGMVHHEAGRLDEARTQYERALAIHRSLGARRTEGLVLGYLATLHHDALRFDEAAEHYRRALERLREVGDRRSVGMYLGYRGVMEHMRGDPESARASYQEALEVLRDVGVRRFEGLFAAFDAAAAHALGTDGAAEWEDAHDILSDIHDPLLLRAADILGSAIRGEALPGDDDADSADIRFARHVADSVSAS